MEYTFKDNISQEEYEEFVQNHPTKSHFMQSYYFGEISRKKGFIPHHVGMIRNDVLVATALLLQKKVIGKCCYIYCPRGFVLNYGDTLLLEAFTKYIKSYTKKFHSIFTAIDPDVKLQSLDIEGKIIKEDKNNFKLIDVFANLGFKHKGFNKNFENREPRYTFRLDLRNSIEDIHKNMHATIRKILNKNNQYGLDLYIGNNTDIDAFYVTMQETSVRENIKPFSKAYYKLFYEIFNKNNMSDLYIAKVNVKNLIVSYSEKIEEIKNNIELLNKMNNKEKKENLKNDYENQLQKAEKLLEDFKNIKDEEIVLSSIITVKYGKKVWTVHGGNHNLLRELNANYLLYDKIICDAKKEGYEIIDFFGTTGNDYLENPIHGIHLFKKRFGGEYTEFIGEFHLVTKPMMYFIYNKILPIYRKMKKK